MNDVEIYSLATQIAHDISNDLNAGIYAKWGGSLKVVWSTEKCFNASAASNAPVTKPPEHIIRLNYELALQIYRDAEEYCNFIKDQEVQRNLSNILRLLNNTQIVTTLPTCFTPDQCVRNMFIAALTWVFFHEYSHLIQEHGFSKNKLFDIAESNTAIQEFDASSSSKLEEKDAAISHTLELSADYEATNFCIFEIIRHFTNDEWMNKEAKGEEYAGLLYLLSCGLSCLFFRFSNDILPKENYIPEGSHPPPILRLEVNIPHIFEMNDSDEIREISGHTLDRKSLVGLCTGAAFSGAIFWSLKITGSPLPSDALLVKGVLNRPEARNYWEIIIETWDELSPLIVKHHRYKTPLLLLLTFTDTVRSYARGINVWPPSPISE